MTLPAIDSIDTLGGTKENHKPVENAATDLDAPKYNVAIADVAMMTHTIARAAYRFKGHATTPVDAAAGFVHDAVWGSGSGVKPTPAHTGTGVYTVTWAATQYDDLGEPHATNFRYAKAWVEASGGVLYHASAYVTAANVVTVRVFDDAGAASDAAGLNIVVEVS